MRFKREHFLYHGTLLYQFPLEQIEALLKMPARQPNYRQKRSHSEFLMNVPLEADQLRQTLTSAFEANEPTKDWPRNLTKKLVADKYSRADWNERL